MSQVLAVIEDDNEIREVLSDFLTSEGYTVIAATNGRDGLERLRAAAELPKVILLDVMMPDMDGEQFRALQREEPRLAAIPVVVMSAGADLAAQVTKLGAAGSLKKPFVDLELILSTVAGF